MRHNQTAPNPNKPKKPLTEKQLLKQNEDLKWLLQQRISENDEMKRALSALAQVLRPYLDIPVCYCSSEND